MCDPVTAMVVTTTIATGMQLRSAQQQARHARAVGRFNARVQENQAQEVRNQATERVNQQRQEAAQVAGQQRAVTAARGALVSEGTALQNIEDTQLISDINAMRIRRNAEARAQSLELGADLTESQAGARASAITNQATANAIANAGQVAAKWHQFNQTSTT